jgi:hypothetical protein
VYECFTWSKVTTRKPASSASGEFESETVSGPTAPATKRRRPSTCATRSALAALQGAGSLISHASCVEEAVLEDALIERRVFAPAVLARVVDEELALRDAGGAEGVRLDDVGPGLEEAPVDVEIIAGCVRREEVAVVEQVLVGVGEALPADVASVIP